jgi:hypothetical protein
MSEVAGKIATQAGAFMLEKPLGGRGMLLGGVPGVAAGKVMVIGGGVVGQNAAEIAIGMGAEVYVYDRSIDRLRELEVLMNGRCSTCFASTLEIEQRLPEMDLVVGAVLVHGAKAPHVISRRQLGLMKRNAVLVDVSIDQGGCFETSRPTTHSDPTYQVDGVTHYCVANMPGAVPITSTYALTNATMPYVVRLADHGAAEGPDRRAGFLKGLKRCGRAGHLRAGGPRPGLEFHAAEDALAASAGGTSGPAGVPSKRATSAASALQRPRRAGRSARMARSGPVMPWGPRRRSTSRRRRRRRWPPPAGRRAGCTARRARARRRSRVLPAQQVGVEGASSRGAIGAARAAGRAIR